MDIHNLATLFGPNILRKTKGGQEAKDLHGEASDYVEESRDVISVVEKLIEYDQQLFQVRFDSYYKDTGSNPCQGKRFTTAIEKLM